MTAKQHGTNKLLQNFEIKIATMKTMFQRDNDEGVWNLDVPSGEIKEREVGVSLRM